MSKAELGVKLLNEDAVIPTKAHDTDSGFDLYAAEDVIIEPGETAVVSTGIAVQLPEGMEAQVRPRSGVTAKTKLRVQIGTIDNDYRGEIGVIVDNSSVRNFRGCGFYLGIDGQSAEPDGGDNIYEDTYLIRKGDKVAQLVVQNLPNVRAIEIDGDLTKTKRGENGYGSTGIRHTSR